MYKRLALVILGVIATTLLAGSVVFAATWQDIHADLVEDGRLDGEYTAEELEDYLNNATVAEYHSIVQDRLNQITQSESGRSVFPFTGFQLMIAGIVAVVLVGGGIALRRFSRPQRS